MFERFTDRARRVLVLAGEECVQMSHPVIGTEHILLGLIHEGEGVAAKALESLGILLETARADVERMVPVGTDGPVYSPPFTPRTKKVLELSLREALQLGHNYIGTEHLLLALVREGESESVAAQVLVNLGADLSRVRQQVVNLLKGYASAKTQAQDPPATMSEYLDILRREAEQYGLLRDRYVGEAFGLAESVIAATTSAPVPTAEYSVRFRDGTEQTFSADRMVRDESSVEFYRGQELVGIASGFSTVIKAAA